MTDWPVKTLGDLMTVQNGYAFDSKYFSPSGKIGLIRIRDLKGGVRTETQFVGTYDDEYVVTVGDYLIGMDGEFRCYEWKGDPALLNQRVCRLRDFGKSLDARFLFYGINKFLREIEDVTGYTTVKHLSSKSILAIEMPVPSLEEQKRIVALLDAATARVTELTACYEQARTHANNLFTSALRDALAPLDSWPVKRLGDLCLFVRGPFGGSLKKSVFVSTGHAVYEQQHAIYGKFDKFRYFVSLNKFQEMKRFEVFPGDILMSCSGTIGKTVIVPVGAPAGIINQALLKLSCSEKLNNQYLCVWMRSLYFQEAVFASVVGVALQNVASVAILKNIPISLPPLEQQKQIVARLDSMRAKTSEMAAAYESKLTAAKNLRQSVLEAAFAGDL